METATFRPGIWDHEALTDRPAQEWLWHGLVAPGRVSLLTSLWKAGKTTLVSLLLARRQQGGMLAERAVRAGKTAVISEEDEELWWERRSRLSFGGQVCFCQPFDGKPKLGPWVDLLDHLVELRGSHGVDLVVIDTLASFLPGRDENHAPVMLEGLQPLRKLTRAGLGVLVAHQ
jgi:AAA domain